MGKNTETGNTMKIGQKYTSALFALLAIWIYNGISILFLFGFQFVFPNDELWNHYSMIDSIACSVLLVIFILWLYHIWRQKKQTNTCTIGSQEANIVPKIIIWVLGFGGFSIIWFIIAESFLGSAPIISESLQSFEESWSYIANESYLWVFLSVVLIGPIVEELLFRGIVFHYLENIKTGYFPIIVSAVLFGLWHQEPVQVVYTAILGLGLGLIYAKTRDLKIVIVMHILNNFLSTLPPTWDTPLIQDTIFYASLLMVLPTIILFIQLIVRYQKEQNLIPPDSNMEN